jgi:hypothetical protein
VSPELDLTPDEINDPQMMQLWAAPYGTRLPAAWDGAVDMAFRFVGMIRRDVKARAAELEPIRLGVWRCETGPPELTLTWHRMLAKHAAVLPARSYCSLLFGLPAERQLGVAPRAALKDFEMDLTGEGASCAAVVEPDPATGQWLTWHTALPVAG